VRRNRVLEAKVRELGGGKWLYAQTYYTEDEFWSEFDRPAYDALREKYGASVLPSVFDKVKFDYEAEARASQVSGLAALRQRFWDMRPICGLYGVYKAWRGGDYLLQKKTAAKPQGLKRD